MIPHHHAPSEIFLLQQIGYASTSMTTWLYVEHVLFGFSVLLCCVLYYCFLLLVLSCVNTFIIYSVFLSFSFSLVLLHVFHLYVKQAINMDYNEFTIACLS